MVLCYCMNHDIHKSTLVELRITIINTTTNPVRNNSGDDGMVAERDHKVVVLLRWWSL